MQNKKAFTLVELIVVITILAILGTIAFISLQGYSSSARNSRRISDINNIKTSLELFILNSGVYPTPDNYETVSYGGDDLWYQGVIGDNVTKNLSKNLPEKPTDPLYEIDYTYSTTNTKKEYELLSFYEGTLSLTSPQPSPLRGEGVITKLFNQVNASTNVTAKIIGNYNQLYVKSANYIVPTPSIINAEVSGTGMILNENNIKSQILSEGENIPNVNIGGIETQTGKLEILLSVYTGSITKETTSTGKILAIEKIQQAYSGTTLSNNGIYKYILGKTSDEEKLGLAETILLNNNFNFTTNETNTNSWCAYNGATYTDSLGLGWTSDELKYDEINNKCYVFGDEDTNAINACNSWVTNNISPTLGEWIWIPARYFITDGNGMSLKDPYYEREVTYNENTYVCRGFAVAKYEMSYDETTPSDSSNTSWDTRAYTGSKTPISMANRLSIVDITQPQAITQCQNMGTGTHLITNNEWMTIARNIEYQNINWSNGTVGDGYIDNGLDNITPPNTNGTIGCYDDDGIYADPTGAGACEIQRQLSLSNNQKIWDLAGNVREHVNKGNTLDGTNFDTNSFSTESMCSNNTTGGWKGWYGTDTQSIVACEMISPYTKEGYGPTGNYNADNGIGRIYDIYNENINNIFFRGANSSGGPYTGIFSLYLDWTSISQGAYAGFRCTK